MYANNAGTGYTNANIFYLFLGAQQQWGMNTIGSRTTRTEAYPLPYSEFCLPIVSGKGYIGVLNYGFGIGVTNFGLTSVTIANNSEDSSYRWTGYTYIVVGAQPQWGFTVFDPAYYKNVNFTLPLSVNGTFCAFSTGYDAKGSTFLWHSMSHFNNVNVGVTGFVFDSRYTFTGLGYLAVCWQKQWGSSASLSGYVAVCIFPISFTTTDYTAVATGVMSAADATFGKENYVNNILWDFTSESQVAFRLSHLDRPSLKYIVIGF